VSLAWQCGWHAWSGTDDGAGQPVLGVAPFALGRWLKWPIGLWFAWILGAVAAEAYAGAIRLPQWLVRWRMAVLFALIGLATSHAALDFVSLHSPSAWGRRADFQIALRLLSGFSDLAFSAAAFVVLNRWVIREAEGHFRGPLVRVLGRLGVMSYSLYLIHVPLLRLILSWMPTGTGLDSWLLRLVVIVPTCLGAAALFFFLIERHFLAGSPIALAGTPLPRRTGLSVARWISTLWGRPIRYPSKSAPSPGIAGERGEPVDPSPQREASESSRRR
jgi:peptidoglycan/LPS O-acetylase OafA/YrhL